MKCKNVLMTFAVGAIAVLLLWLFVKPKDSRENIDISDGIIKQQNVDSLVTSAAENTLNSTQTLVYSNNVSESIDTNSPVISLSGPIDSDSAGVFEYVKIALLRLVQTMDVPKDVNVNVEIQNENVTVIFSKVYYSDEGQPLLGSEFYVVVVIDIATKTVQGVAIGG